MRKNKKNRKTRSASVENHSSRVIDLNTGIGPRLYQQDPLGASWRSYPRGSVRQGVIERLKQKQESELTGDDWWQLGEYQVIEGLSSSDESTINAGSQALMKGAHLTPPHAGCLLDLGWLLCYKGLDQMALFYLDKATEITPNSRDIWSLVGWACIGAGDRKRAVNAFQKAVGLPTASDTDHKTLSSLLNGIELDKLRKNLVFKKFDDEVFRGKHGDAADAARSGVMQFKQLMESDPGDLDMAYRLAYCHYVLGQLDHAEPLLLRVIGEKENHADALTLLGLIAMKRNKPDQQRNYYERAVRSDAHHVLANTNLASLYLDKGEFHAARPLLLRAIESAPQNDPHLPIALDLLGNIYGSVECDFDQEAELHRRAIALDPDRPLFHANLAVALISAGRVKDAHRIIQEAKRKGFVLPNLSLLEDLVRIYQDRSMHPYQVMQFIESLSAGIGWPALRPLLRNAWARRNVIDVGERVDFLGVLGMMASKAGDHELALDIWKLGASLPDGDPFEPNIAVELTNLGRHAEALLAAEQMSMDTPRSWTILGNTRLYAGHYKSALEAYRIAMDKDERFILPLANAVSAARSGFLAEELGPFIDRLRSDWQSTLTGRSLIAQALFLQGKLTSAVTFFQAALWRDGEILTPEEMWEADRDVDDLSLLGVPNLGDHYSAAKCFLELGQLDLLMELVAKVNEWPKWMNGDWVILHAEACLAADDLDQASMLISQMKDQPPPKIVAAKVAIQREDFEEADRLINLGLIDEAADGFNYPGGRPDAVFRALAAERSLALGEPERAEELAREAIRRDPSCVSARLALSASLDGRCLEDDRQQQIRDGLRRSPGHPALISSLITSLITSGDPETANAELNSVRTLLEERGANEVAHRLGESIAVDRLSRISPETLIDSSSGSAWTWIEDLEPPLKDWMRGAYLSFMRGNELGAAYALYLSKVAEYLLVTRIMMPFREVATDTKPPYSDRHRDCSRFMDGGAPPSIGGIARLLESAASNYRSSDDELTKNFREAVKSGRLGDSRRLRDPDLISQLTDLGRARNSMAHLGEQDLDALTSATRSVVDRGRPGLLLLLFQPI